MYTNRLADEKSPYLLQHAHNPVDWYPWGDAAFAKARAEDKPIFLSIGYSTCHWCHVMERESFESEEVAAVLNRSFVPIKLDREERPDIDRIYMAFVQATSGSGGWPMSVWLTPDLKPFFGGTYFPPDNRYGRPGFKSILEYIANAWLSDRQRIIQSSHDIVAELRKQAEWEPGAGWLDGSIADTCFAVFRRSYDSKLGGFGQAPKFPRPVTFNFLFRYYKKSGNREALDMALHTLREMARGGMNDQLGGGFHRYSVDERWFVPHFEKMLYDQGQLAVSYLEAFQISGDPFFAQVAQDILEYVLRDMTHEGGAFYSAEDADSVIDSRVPTEKGEGAFYIFTAAEIEEVLGPQAAEWFNFRYGVERDGNVRNDPHGEFTGRNILFEARTVAETARRFSVNEAELVKALDDATAKLMRARNKRVRPHLDDKILTSWNGLMISAFALGGQVLNQPRYLTAAKGAADFILERMSQPTLLRRFREGDAAIPGFLDDYAFFASSLVDLYECTLEERYLSEAIRLAAEMVDRFEDKQGGGFYSTAGEDPTLVMRMKDDYDGAEPSGNSGAATLLLRLAEMTAAGSFRESAERCLKAFAQRLRTVPHATPQLIVALMFSQTKPKQIVLAGKPGSEDLDALLAEVHRHFVAHRILLLADGELLPHTQPMTPIDGKAAAYVCENFACQLPVTDPAQLAPLLV
ncbi:MAG: thioredoxin domain-containing protein [Bryobacterales bacterium]|nr:thioredoxin domain-containing protein [Bryobacterales bacterium]